MIIPSITFGALTPQHREEPMSYKNGDVIRTGNGEVFVHFSGNYYNLSSANEARGRQNLNRYDFGKCEVIGSLVNTGNLWTTAAGGDASTTKKL